MAADDLTPEQILAAWEVAKTSAPVPWRTSDDVILNVIAGNNPTYKYKDQIPKLKAAPAIHPEAQPLARILTDTSSRHYLYAEQLADMVADLIGSKPLSRSEWTLVAGDAKNVLCVVFDPLGDQFYDYGAKAFLYAPVKVCLGAVPILWIRFKVSLLGLSMTPMMLPVRARNFKSVSVSDHSVIPMPGRNTAERLVAAVERILQGYGFLAVSEVVSE